MSDENEPTPRPGIPRRIALGAAFGGALGATGPTLHTRASAAITPIPVAFLIDEGATIIDFCGPWEVFQDAGDFHLYTVAPTRTPITASGGMTITPHFSIADAPAAKIVVIPAQSGGRSEAPTTRAKIAWLQRAAQSADVILSVCTGNFLMARTGLLDGHRATTHHNFFDAFAQQFPRLEVVRDRRFIDNGKFVSAGGLTSGIDGALHVVERFKGRDAATKTAEYMEYQSPAWRI